MANVTGGESRRRGWEGARELLRGWRDPGSWLVLGAWIVTTMVTIKVLFDALEISCFYGDDFTAFLMAHEQPLWRTVLEPLGSQLVPLHRLLTLAIYRAAPMSWTAATLVLWTFHVTSMMVLYGILRSFGSWRYDIVVVAFYATNVLAGVQLTWFSSGMTRAPYVFFSLLAIHQYLSFGRSGARRHLALVVLLQLLALGFYSKAIFIPLYCLVVDFAFRGRAALSRSLTEPARWLAVAVMLAVDVSYVLAARSVLHDVHAAINLNPEVLFGCVLYGLEMMAHIGVGASHDYWTRDSEPFALAVWGACFAYSVLRAPRTLFLWVLTVLLVVVNVLLPALSMRAVVFGVAISLERRHYFEICFLAAPLLRQIAWLLKDQPPLFRRPSWHAASPLIVGVALLAYAARGHANFLSIARANPEPRACVYLRTLAEGLDAVNVAEKGNLRFVDRPLPRYLNTFDFDFVRLSQLFMVLGQRAKFGRGGWRVLDDGTVTRDEKPAGKKR